GDAEDIAFCVQGGVQFLQCRRYVCGLGSNGPGSWHSSPRQLRPHGIFGRRRPGTRAGDSPDGGTGWLDVSLSLQPVRYSRLRQAGDGLLRVIPYSVERETRLDALLLNESS